MHVVFVDTTLTTPPAGGSHTFLVAACKGLVNQGWTTSVVTPTGPDESFLKALQEVGSGVHVDLWRRTHLPEERGRRLASWVNDRDPEVYVISTSPATGWLALPQLKPEIATVSIAHNDNSAYYEPLSHYGPLIDIAVGVSAEVHRKIVSVSGMPSERARQIPYGVEPISRSEMESRSNRSGTVSSLKIGYVGRLIQGQKRVMEMVPLVSELKRRKIEFELHLVGDGSDRQRLFDGFAGNGTLDHVHFWGWQTHDEVKQRLRDLGVFILMSEYEGLPVALLEAMGYGLAPVISRIASGNTELINEGQNGYLAEVGDIRGFAEKLERLSRNRSLLREIQWAAWNTSQEYTVQRMVESYEKCFQDARTSKFSRDCRIRGGGSYAPMPSSISRYPSWLRRIKYRFPGFKSGAIY